MRVITVNVLEQGAQQTIDERVCTAHETFIRRVAMDDILSTFYKVSIKYYIAQ